MKYQKLIQKGIEDSGLSHSQIILKLNSKGIHVDVSLLSKMRHGKFVSTRDDLNIALAEILGIDSARLRVAAIKEKLSPELVELLKKIG